MTAPVRELSIDELLLLGLAYRQERVCVHPRHDNAVAACELSLANLLSFRDVIQGHDEYEITPAGRARIRVALKGTL